MYFILISLANAHLIGFGDWGCKGNSGMTTSESINAYLVANPPEAVLLLGDNFYADGIDPYLGIGDPRFDRFSNVLAKGVRDVPFYVILGNHDIKQGEASARAQIAYSMINPQWQMPSKNYLRRFNNGVCVWFIDTSKAQVDRLSMDWLEMSLRESADTCMWKIFASHYPLVSAGVYRKDKSVAKIRSTLLPIINQYGIDIYLSGHDHNSQLLRDTEMPGCVFLIAAAVCDINPKSIDPAKTLPSVTLVWGDDRKQPVVVKIHAQHDQISYSFLKAKKNPQILSEHIIYRAQMSS